ncbi:acetyl-CoA synthetase-like protein [Hysterangium stoloniferum]|nr:acetyl-CoA synthetase-like protein [Hysterangium stoloniferum]
MTAMQFTPTPESIPPPRVVFRLQQPHPPLPVNATPLRLTEGQNPISFILRAASIFPDKLALLHKDVKHAVAYSFAVWAQRIQNLAYALIQTGIRAGDRVAVIAPNWQLVKPSPLIADAHFGVLAARAVITPINTRLTKPEVDYILHHSGAQLVLVDHEYAHLVKGSRLKVVVSKDTGLSDDPYEQFLSSGRCFSQERSWGGLEMECDENANASLCYTSGTTGKPKGVISTLRGSYLAAAANVIEAGLNQDSVYLWILPMFHACGWTFPWANVLAYTTQVTLRTVSYDLIWKNFLHSGVTHYCAAPTVQIGIVNAGEARRLGNRIVAVIAGSAPTAHLIGELEKIGIQPVHVYGLTSTYGPFTRNYVQPSWATLSHEERAKRMARQGHAFATADEARVVLRNPDGSLQDVPDDGKTLGEIAVRGNIVMKEYFRDPDATAKAFLGGYFATGDLAVKNPDQSISIQDRSKDIIISGGEFNASSLAIEQELAEHPHVLEVAVVARPHEKWGERPAAFVVLNRLGSDKWNGSHDDFEKDLKRWVKGKLPGFAIPEWVDVVQELPKTSTGKIQKNRLRQMVSDAIKSKL